MTQVCLVLGQRANHISEATSFGNRVAFGTYVNNFHESERFFWLEM
jgi:hypothetical protein